MPVQALGCVRGEMLWSFAVPSLTVALDCVAVSSSDSLTADESQHIDKCEVSCIRMNNFKLLPHVAGCEINCSRKKKILASLWIHHWKHLLFTELWSKEERNLISSTNDRWIPWSTGMDNVCRARFSSENACLDTAH